MRWNNLLGVLMQCDRYSPDYELTSSSSREGRLPPAGGTGVVPVYRGAMFVKFDPGSFPYLLVRPIGDHLLVPTWVSRWPPRAVIVKGGPTGAIARATCP